MKLITHRAIFLTAIGLSVCILVSSCKDKKSYQIDPDFSKYCEQKEKAKRSVDGTDTTFLQFTFGMTENQVNNKLDSLYKKGTLQIDESSAYSYKLYTGRAPFDTLNCNIQTSFYHNKLYQIRVVAKDKNNSLIGSRLSATLMMDALTDKYGYYDHHYALIEGQDTYAWFKNNIEIKVFEGSNGAVIQYTNLKLESLADFEADQNQDSAKMKTTKDL